MARRTLYPLAIVLFVFGSTFSLACSGGSQDEEEANNNCPPGQTSSSLGGCVREQSPSADDTGTIPDTTSDDTGIDSVDTADDSDDADATEEEPGCDPECDEDEFCLDGQCREGAECTPDEKLGCVDSGTLRVCTEKGVGFREEPCPNDEPNCVSFRKEGCTENKPECFEPKCTDKVCSPDETFCGDDVTLMECSSDGMSSDQVKICRGKCRGGECVSACEGNAKSYIGCGFYAIDMDNYTINCNSDQTCQDIGGLFGSAGECVNGVCTCTNSSGSNCQETNVNGQQYAVTISNTSNTDVDIDIQKPDGTSVKSGTVPSNDLEVFDLPPNHTEDSGISKNSYRIEAQGPVTVHQFNPKNQADVFSNDASLVLPSNAMGKEYTVIGWESMESPRDPSTVHQTGRPYVTIVAVEQGTTTVDVTVEAEVLSGNGVQALSPGDSATYDLDQGQVVQLMTKQETGNDLTGTSISADQKVAVFSGQECAEVPNGTAACDHLEQQLLPVSTWGERYILSKFKPRGSEPDFYRVVAAKDGTTLSTEPPISGVDGETLDAGEMLEFDLEPSVVIEGDKPISVGQFMVGSQHSGVTEECDSRPGTIGDPAFMIDVPESQFRSDYVIYTPSGYQQDWLNIVKPTGATVEIDGTALSQSGDEIASSGFEVVRKEVQPGTHKVTSSEPIGLYSYGFECDVSYAYPGGLDLKTNTRK